MRDRVDIEDVVEDSHVLLSPRVGEVDLYHALVAELDPESLLGSWLQEQVHHVDVFPFLVAYCSDEPCNK